MRRDKAKARAEELQATAEPGVMVYAFHKGRNSWDVRKRKVQGDRYEHPEIVEG
jgi:hypothetical protein